MRGRGEDSGLGLPFLPVGGRRAGALAGIYFLDLFNLRFYEAFHGRVAALAVSLDLLLDHHFFLFFTREEGFSALGAEV